MGSRGGRAGRAGGRSSCRSARRCARGRRSVDNYFFADDFLHLFDLVTRSPATLSHADLGADICTSCATPCFLGMFEAFGPRPRPWFWTVLLTHLVNVALLHRIVRRFTADLTLACAAALCWGTCPRWRAPSLVLGFTVRSWRPTLVLVVLACLADVMVSGDEVTPRRALAWGGLLILAGGYFAPVLGVAAVFALVVLIALPRAGSRRAPSVSWPWLGP